MKTKFDENVAHDIPVTKNSSEPELPWKLSESELTKIDAAGEDYKVAVTAPPLHVRAIFVALLVAAIFVVILNNMVNMAIDNNDMQIDISKKDRQVSLAQTQLAAVKGEKDALADNSAKMEKRINDLNSQKELYSAVIETLTKKTDDSPTN